MRTRNAIAFSREDTVLGVLLLAAPLTFVAAGAGWAPALQFCLSVVSIIPLAGFIGSATESLADSLGGKIGGLLNATFGNAPDLLVGYFGVQRGLIPLVKATLVGALISNSALIMGLCYVVAGLLYGRPRFKRDEAGHHSVLMYLTVAAILFPSIGALVLCGGSQCRGSADAGIILHISVGISLVLLASYAAYIAFGIFGLESLRRRNPIASEERLRGSRSVAEQRPGWPLWFSVTVLAGATAGLIPITDILTGSVGDITRLLGWSQVFVGLIIVANAGNVAEGYAAIKLAFLRGGVDPHEADSGLDLALGIASASSVQIATFVAPIIVLYSLTSHHMNLVFDPVELSILGLLAIVFAYIAHDGESNWLEGVQLLALYAMAAIVFYALPVQVFGA